MRRFLSSLSYSLAHHKHRASVAWSFLSGTLTEEQAFILIRDAQETLGSWCLVSIDARDVLERLRDQYVDQPEFPRLAAEAAERVYSKWPGDSSDFTSAQIDWAQEIAEDYARRDGVPLIEDDNVEEMDEENDEDVEI